MNRTFIESLSEVLKILLVNEKITTKKTTLFSLTDKQILSPIGDILPLLNHQTSPLKDQFISLEKLQKFVKELTKNNLLIRLNHIGFCYKVKSQEEEKERLIQLVKNSNLHLYIEPSNDEGVWFFLGNTENWEDTLLELIPIEETKDTWKDFWLPHVQIDIDTTLTEGEIKNYIKSFFGESVYPFSIGIDGVVYIVRNRLGTIDGINITLDLATNARDVKYHRKHILKQLDK